MECVPFKVNISIIEGGTFDRDYVLATGDPAEAIDLTGFTAKFAVLAKINDSVPLISGTEGSATWEADVDSGIYFSVDIVGGYKFYLNDHDTEGICAAHKDLTGYYDVFLYSPAGEAVYKIYGVCNIQAAGVRWA